MAFTVVFDGDIKDFAGNPLKTDTPFGRPVAVSVGDVIEENNELRECLDNISSRALTALA